MESKPDRLKHMLLECLLTKKNQSMEEKKGKILKEENDWSRD